MVLGIADKFSVQKVCRIKYIVGHESSLDKQNESGLLDSVLNHIVLTYSGAQTRHSLINVITNIHEAMVGDITSHLENMEIIQQGEIDSTAR